MVINPKGVAAWLIENTSLTFDQISDFCKLHYMEVEAIANDEIKILPSNPIESHQLSRAEIERCEGDENAKLELNSLFKTLTTPPKKAKRYKPLAKRSLIPSAVLYMVLKYPSIKDSDLCRLIGTTKNTVAKIRDGSYKGINDISPKSPVLADFCSHANMIDLLEKYNIQEAGNDEL